MRLVRDMTLDDVEFDHEDYDRDRWPVWREWADLVHAANGVVRVAYPFSGAPTRQQVELDGFPAVYAMCAIDVLGIPAMAGRDGRITAVDPRDGAPVVVSVRGGQWRRWPAAGTCPAGAGPSRRPAR
jgi:hypothetical protein